MNFRPRRQEPPELNLIPMIDVLIVLLIFLVLTTTFSRAAPLHIRLPEASVAGAVQSVSGGVQIVIGPQGQYRINQRDLPDNQPATVRQALQEAAGGNPDPLITIDADRQTTHQSVITVLDAAGQLGYRQVNFMAESGSGQ